MEERGKEGGREGGREREILGSLALMPAEAMGVP